MKCSRVNIECLYRNIGVDIVNELDQLLKRVLDYYNGFFSDTKDLKFMMQCEIFIKDYFNNFAQDLYNLNDDTLFSLSKDITRVVRAKYGVFDSIDPNMLDKIILEYGNKKIAYYITKFELKLFSELDNNIKLNLFKFEYPGMNSILELKPYLKNRIRFLYEKGFETIQQLTELTEDEVIRLWQPGSKMGVAVVESVHLLGYSFKGEKDIDKDVSK